MTTTDIGSGAAAADGCPKNIIVTLKGELDAVWNNDAIKLLAPALTTASDGYNLTMSISAAANGDASMLWVGGCVSVDKGTDGKLLCVRAGVVGNFVKNATIAWMTKAKFDAATTAWPALGTDYVSVLYTDTLITATPNCGGTSDTCARTLFYAASTTNFVFTYY